MLNTTLYGHTGYSAKENVNNTDIVYLHGSLQLIFDGIRKEKKSGAIFVQTAPFSYLYLFILSWKHSVQIHGIVSRSPNFPLESPESSDICHTDP